MKRIAWDSKLLIKLDELKLWQVACLIVAIGLCVFFSGMNGGFQGDDNLQIVDNIPVHSLSNVGSFFTSSTFWNGETLVGSFYRPVMTTTFSLIYSTFGANPMAFHIFQLLLYMGCTLVLFLFIKSFFRPALALLVVLLFLVHPINSQAVYAIPSMQEPLFFLFGTLALLTLSRSQTNKSFIIAGVFLLLSLLSKETGIVFACLCLLYLGIFKRERILTFIKIMAIPAVIYLALRGNAIGLLPETIHAAPISTLDFSQRMLTLPSIILFYIMQFLFPAQLATSYYWTNQSFSLITTILPLLVVLCIIAGLVYVGFLIKKRNTKNEQTYYLFFSIWAGIGLLPYLQIVPLDMTACEPWFFASIPGFLGIITVALSVMISKRQTKWIYIVAIPIIIVLGVRTAIRGVDYHTQFTLASKDISIAKDNYLAMNNLAQSLIQKNQLSEAASYAQRSTEIYPAVTNYTNLGVIRQKQGNFVGAKEAYEKALTYGNLGITYENLGIVNLTIGDARENITFLQEALKAYPKDSRLWTYLAIQEAEDGSRTEAKTAITKAVSYGSIPPQLYYAIVTAQSFDISLPGSNRVIHLP